MSIKGATVFFKPDEAKFLGMGITRALEDLKETSSNVRINWNPEARKIIKEMVSAGSSLKIKLEKIGIDIRPLPPFEEGDENEFLTKES